MNKRCTMLKQARAAWGNALPVWLEALARHCDRTSQRKAAVALGISAASVNLLLNNKYAPRPLDAMQARISDYFKIGAEGLECPVLGPIAAGECRKHQNAPLVTCNPLNLQLYRACRGGCPHYSKEAEK